MSAPIRLAGMTPQQVVDLGRAHGWTPINNGSWLTLRRTYLLPTPELVLCTSEEFARQPFGKWDKPTYERHEFLSFFFAQAGTKSDGGPIHKLRGQITYGDADSPWIGRHDSEVSQRRALEILTAAPPADAINPTPETGGSL